MEKRMSANALSVLLCCFAVLGIASSDDSLTNKCAALFPKVSECLPFVTAQAAAPTTACCGSVTEIKATDPACLCFIIQQIHNGTNSAAKGAGLQESRLLQLPSACRLQNASISQCPRLLHLSPNSPDAAIFTNASTAAAPSGPTVTTPVSTPGTSSSSDISQSDGVWQKPQLAGCILVVAAILFHAFPTGFSLHV